MIRTLYDLTLLAMESQQVICLRTAKIAAGGKDAHEEACLMVAEKVAAGFDESWRVMMGASTDSVVKRVRRKVRANARRLSR
jgi:hypothetical protein